MQAMLPDGFQYSQFKFTTYISLTHTHIFLQVLISLSSKTFVITNLLETLLENIQIQPMIRIHLHLTV